MRYTSVYFRKTDIFVVVLVETWRGITIQTGDVAKFASDVAPEVLGTVVLEALNRFRQYQPELEDRAAYAKPMLKVLGFKTFAAFCRGTREVGVYVEDDTASVIATKPSGRTGFLALTVDDYPDMGKVRCKLEPLNLGMAI